MPTSTDKPKRRWRPRWSMKTMFVGVTIVCVMVWLIVAPAEQQKRAVVALRENESITILYDYELRTLSDGSAQLIPDAEILLPGPAWLRDLIGVDYFADVVYVDLYGRQVRDDDLRRLRHFGKLEMLNLENCFSITDIGRKHLMRLTSLSVLYVDTSLTAFPPEIGKLTNLKQLEIRYNQSTTLPSGIGKLTKLETLRLEYCQFTTLPPEIGRLVKLTKLDLMGNQLTSLPPEIGKLTSLMSLDVLGNQLTEIPPEIGQLAKLTELTLNGNDLTAIPDEIGRLVVLTKLNLVGNRLTSLPPEIGKLTSLTSLEVPGNQLTEIPPEIGQLTKLTELILSSNDLTTIPVEIGQLTKLTKLTLSENSITDADLEHLKSLRNLKELYLHNTSVTQEGVADLQRALPNCKIESHFWRRRRSVPESELDSLFE